MADISKINLPNSSVYNLKDSVARSNIGTLSSLTTTAKTNLVAAINEINGTSGDAYTKAETDALLAKKPGEITTGKQYTIDGRIVTAGTGAEAFNSLTDNTASGMYSHAEGCHTTASGAHSHAEGNATTASGNYSHAEGNGTTASGNYSHAEGYGTTASGQHSHAEGTTTASGNYSHAEGFSTNAYGDYSHAEGQYTTITTSGKYSHAEGRFTIASSEHQHVQGKYNVADANDTYAFIIGNGTAEDARHNAFAVDWNGLIYVNGAATGVDVSALAPQSTTYTKDEVDTALSGKQPTLNAAQQAAVASGITAAKVQQYDKDSAALVEIVDSGAKNMAPVATGSKSGQGYFFNNANSISKIASGDAVAISFDYELSNGQLSVQLTNSSGSVISSTAVYTPSGTTSGHKDAIVTTSADAYGYNAYFGGSGTAKISNFMICSKAAWDVSHKYVPYCPTMAKLYEMINALQEN